MNTSIKLTKTQIPPQILEVASASGTSYKTCSDIYPQTDLMVLGQKWGRLYVHSSPFPCIDNWVINFACNSLVHVDQINVTRRHHSTSLFEVIFHLSCELWIPKRKASEMFFRVLPPQCSFAWASCIGIKCLHSLVFSFGILHKEIYQKWFRRLHLFCSNPNNLTMLRKLRSGLPPLMPVNIVLEIYLKNESAFQMLGLFKCHRFSWN